VRSAVAGERDAADALVCLVWPDAFKIARSILHEREAAEDAAQEACARALVALSTLRHPERFAVWFYRIVVNEARAQHRKRPKHDEPDREAAAPDDPREEGLDLRRAIAALGANLRVTIVLYYYYDFTTAEIAEILQISMVAVRLRLMVARRKLRSLLECGTGAATGEEECSHEPEPAR
jgi:RNA polymerase sigma factor (sigma-70 family)